MNSNEKPCSLNTPVYSKEQCNALFASLLVDDHLYPDAVLPKKIHLNYSKEQIFECYKIAHQLWKQGVDRASLCKKIEKLIWGCPFSEEDKYDYYVMRAKIKHVRFTYIYGCDQHKYPRLFDRVTALMGNLQDAFKNNQRVRSTLLSIALRLVLSRIPYFLVTRSMYHFQQSSVQSFQEYIQREVEFIQKHIIDDRVTSKEFHEMRKVISRQVALYDNLDTLYPSEYHRNIIQYLSTINGMMGSMHDDLIAAKFNKTQNYYEDKFELPKEIKKYLIAFTNSHSLKAG